MRPVGPGNRPVHLIFGFITGTAHTKYYGISGARIDCVPEK